MITTIKKSILLKPIAVIMAFSILTLSLTKVDDKVTLRAGTPVLLETTQRIMSDNLSAGQSLDFRVRFDVKAGDKMVIRAGSVAKGQVSRIQQARSLGRKGFAEIQIRSVQSVDGQMVPLSGGNVYSEGEDKQALAWGLGIFVCVLFLFIKGKNSELPAGTSVDANVAMDMQIEGESLVYLNE